MLFFLRWSLTLYVFTLLTGGVPEWPVVRPAVVDGLVGMHLPVNT